MKTQRSEEEMERGTVAVWLKRSAKRRLPRLKRIKTSVDNGARLGDFQIRFLAKVMEDMKDAMPYFDKHPEMQQMATRMVSLYHDITEQAMKNEQERIQQRVPRIDLPEFSDDTPNR